MFRRLFIALALLVAAAVPAWAQSFPVTIKHAYGETTVPAKPLRIVTWGWSTQDAVIALGEVPVGIPFFGYGGDIVEYFTRYRRQLRSRADIARVSGLSDADIKRLRTLYPQR